MSPLLLTAFAAISIISELVSAQGSYKRLCYYTNWAQYRPNEGKYLPEDVDPSLCTHLVYAFAKMKGNQLEAFEWNDESTEWMKGMYDRFNQLKMRYTTLKTLLAVGGWNMASKPFSDMVATPAGRKEFATTSVRFLRERNFDGLDLDWEYPANRGSPPEDKGRYTELVMEIRRAFDEDARRTGKEPLLLTSAVAAGKDKIDTAYDIPQICRDMDIISVMTYDLHGSWEDITGHNSPLYAHKGETGNQRYLNMDWAANYWVQSGCPKSKLVIGMGLYGRSFTLANPYDNGLMSPVKGKGEAGKYTREGGFLAYYEICDMQKKGAQTYYIKEQEVPYVVMKDLWVGYDDVDSLRIKVQWMKQNGFAGIMVWALDLDDFRGTHCGQGPYPLLNAINQELVGAIAIPPKSRPDRVNADRSQTQNNDIWNQNSINSWDQPANTWDRPQVNNWGQQQSNNANYPPPPTTTQANLPHLTNEFKCPPNENTYFSSPTSCDDYFICASGLSFKFTCTAPLKWNPVSNFCDWPENVMCDIKKPVKTEPAPVPAAQPVPAPAPVISAVPAIKHIPEVSVISSFKRIPAISAIPALKSSVQYIPTTSAPAPTTPRPPRKPRTRPPTYAPITRIPIAVPTTNPLFTQPTPPWLDWSAWINEFWKALTSLTGGQSAWMQQTLQSAASQATSQVMGTAQPQVVGIGQHNQNIQPNPPNPPKQSNSFCVGKTNGIHSDPLDCSKYIDCVDGREYRGTCPAGTAFDTTYGVCDFTHKVTRCGGNGLQQW